MRKTKSKQRPRKPAPRKFTSPAEWGAAFEAAAIRDPSPPSSDRPDAPRLRSEQTMPLFPVTLDDASQNTRAVIVAVPARVVECGRARIVGRFWGPDEKGKQRGAGWVYALVDASLATSLGRDFVVTEKELAKWQKGAG